MRDPQYMTWVRGLGCLFEATSYSCDGPIDAHHAGINKGMGRKADDDTCIPLCRKHHQDLECLTGVASFKLGWDKAVRRAFHEQAIEAVRDVDRAIKLGGRVRILDAVAGLSFAVDYAEDPAKAANSWNARQA